MFSHFPVKFTVENLCTPELCPSQSSCRKRKRSQVNSSSCMTFSPGQRKETHTHTPHTPIYRLHTCTYGHTFSQAHTEVCTNVHTITQAWSSTYINAHTHSYKQTHVRRKKSHQRKQKQTTYRKGRDTQEDGEWSIKRGGGNIVVFSFS